eukprot:TRINITY_DN14331_c0_g2_i1.p1 TRINITY_DN14331_c0_g2~~TRINITY_DN14331_c0_g2_i1.p1  ORF type:complete len:238 (+),score=57.04 TRINITY_DN14331_c0_g2_i1:107-820(+)
MTFSRSSRANRRHGAILITAVVLAVPALVAFTGGAAPLTRIHRSRVTTSAEGSQSSTSTALVKVTEESTVATAGVLAGVAGLVLGGVWVGGALFAASSYLARKDDDLSKGLRGVSEASLQALNFVDYLNNKYEVTAKAGSAVTDALKSSGSSSSTSGTTTTDSVDVAGAFRSVGDAIQDFDKEVGLKDTLGSIIISSGDLAYQAVDKVIELEKEYKLTDQLKAKIDDLNAEVKNTKA